MRSMKDSGIEWLGAIPDHWQTITISQLADQTKTPNDGMKETNLLSLSYGKIKRRDIDATEGLLPASFEGYNIVEPNDVVLRFTDLQNDQKSLRVGRVTERGIITSAYTTIRPSNVEDSEYLYYCLHSYDLRKGFYGMGAGVRQGLKWQEAKYIEIPWPSLEERNKITSTLDTQCEKIDSAIEAAKKSIEEYKAYKQSVIFEAVTKGLDPNVQMKDSGIEWLGNIPYSWGVAPIKTMFSIKKNIAGKLGYDVLSVTQHGLKIKDLTDMKGQHSSDYSKYQLVNPGDFVMNHMDLLTGWIDISEFFGVTSPDYRVFTLTGNACARYYLYVFQTYYNARVFFGNGKGVSGKGRWRLPKPEFLNLAIPIPPLDLQEKISQFLDAQSKVIDSAVQAKQSIIEELKAYKKSLIYEVVTGKREIDGC